MQYFFILLITLVISFTAQAVPACNLPTQKVNVGYLRTAPVGECKYFGTVSGQRKERECASKTQDYGHNCYQITKDYPLFLKHCYGCL